MVVLPSRARCGVDLGSARSIDDATSGRYELVRGGVELFRERPLVGLGSGSFAEEYRRARPRVGRAAGDSASHTIPITVAAEQGLDRAAGLPGPARGRAAPAPARRRGYAGRAGVAAAFAALVVHTWLYAAFLEDPLTWALLAVGTALARPRVRLPAMAARAGAAPSPGGPTRSPAPPPASTGAR